MNALKFAALLVAAMPLIAAEPLVRIAPVRKAVEIGGQPVSIAASGEVTAAEHPNLYRVSLAVDLSDLQAHATDILRAGVERSEACGQKAPHSGRDAGSGESDRGAAGEDAFRAMGLRQGVGKERH
jgi:hypothetical protein